MKTVQGIGGVFLYARDPEALANWYREHLGLELESWGKSFGCEWPSQDVEETGREVPRVVARPRSMLRPLRPAERLRTSVPRARVALLPDVVPVPPRERTMLRVPKS